MATAADQAAHAHQREVAFDYASSDIRNEYRSGFETAMRTPLETEKASVEEAGIAGSDEETGLAKVAAATFDVAEASSNSSSDKELITQVISTEDDPSLNPWTFRMWFVGLGLSVFGGVLAEIYYFKPQTVLVSVMFLAIISYVLGEGLAVFIPRRGIFKWLNPGPFNKKEHAAIVIMASAAANSALGTEILAVQRLYYNQTPNAALSIFMLFSSQLLGYGMAGVMRSILLYPTRMLCPTVLPLISMFETLHGERHEVQKKLKLFWVAFFLIFFWELLPEWIFPLITGFSIFCLANPNSMPFTLVFGGTNGNEGLGLLSLCLDWQYISGGVNPLAIPLQAQMANFIGYLLCIAVFCGVWFGNIYNAQSFPFLSQTLFNADGSPYNQLLILDDNFEVDYTKLELSFSATIVHLLLWNREDLAAAWSWATPNNLLRMARNFNWKFWQASSEMAAPANQEDLDPHYKEMLKYKDSPDWWYGVTWLVAMVVGLIVIYEANSTLPWWGFFISLILALICILFFGALGAVTGLNATYSTFLQMIGGYLHPGKHVANMYFVLWSYNSVAQGLLVLRDLKIAQYVKLPPRCTYTVQILGTLIGALLNWVMMNSIVTNQRDILLSVEGTNIWSGQQPQSYNSQAIAWGGLSHQLFDVGKEYQWVTLAFLLGIGAPVPFWIIHKFLPQLKLDYFSLFWSHSFDVIHSSYIGWLCVGINSSILSYFALAFWSQWYLRRKYPVWFRKYNYILAAALDGGTQVMVFILSFAVQGASGDAHLFPAWWGANQGGNYDRCLYTSY
ncbi:oligopeptide transporter [Dacryopinax primogenitus]|uniref:Oligopeptide transporter n=1 Tax=Dacryopinax primogenitus (strain DJM 731) TaxID=1858805 RepID=M5FYG1_DACPD|nr:oligopeptide transporter [Dacryopinax primogenitus]EJU00895.1 oligopeptide transporter [Dacryopinax primogenitus]